MPPLATTLSQVTNNGRPVQEKNGDFTIKDALQATFGRNAQFGGVNGAYLHVPFCFHKCHYCDFYSIVDSRNRQPQFVDRLVGELEAAADLIDFSGQFRTVFVGGGTPTLLEVSLWERLLPRMRAALRLIEVVEFTVEANPETVTPELASVLKSGGVNRVSVGCQSFNPRHLKTLERWHDPRNVHRSVEMLRAAGITNINLDLIFAVPGQSLEEWLADLDEALSLNPTHISCYGLTYEPNTPMTVKMKAGAIEPAEQEVEAEMYVATMERLRAAGYEHYEISNWAKRAAENDGATDAFRCEHNLVYWRNENWWAFGPSASGHMNGLRWKNVARLGEYLDSAEHNALPPITDVERLDEDGRIGEQLMLGLRLIDGIAAEEADRLLSQGVRAETRQRAIYRAVEKGLLIHDGRGLRFTAEGLLRADAVIGQLL